MNYYELSFKTTGLLFHRVIQWGYLNILTLLKLGKRPKHTRKHFKHNHRLKNAKNTFQKQKLPKHSGQFQRNTSPQRSKNFELFRTKSKSFPKIPNHSKKNKSFQQIPDHSTKSKKQIIPKTKIKTSITFQNVPNHSKKSKIYQIHIRINMKFWRFLNDSLAPYFSK